MIFYKSGSNVKDIFEKFSKYLITANLTPFIIFLFEVD